MKATLALLSFTVLATARPITPKEKIAECPRVVDAYTRVSDFHGYLFNGDSFYTIVQKGEIRQASFEAKITETYKNVTSVTAAIYDQDRHEMHLFNDRTGYHFDKENNLVNVKQAPAEMSPKLAFWWKVQTVVLVDGDKIALLDKTWKPVKDSSIEKDVLQFLKQLEEQPQIRGIDGAGSDSTTIWMKDGMQALKKGADHIETTVYNWPALVDDGWSCIGQNSTVPLKEVASTPSGAKDENEGETESPKTSTATIEVGIEKEKVLTGERPKTADRTGTKTLSTNSEQCSGSYVTVTFRDAILKHHNDARSLLAAGKYEMKGSLLPAAADMMKLTWNCSLEAYIRDHVAACNYEHMENAPHGQNQAEGGQTGKVDDVQFANTAVESWLSEFAEFGWDNVPVYFDPAGHATQVMHAESSSLGCAIQHCPKPDMDYVNLHCMYWPAGNLPGSTVYTAGEPCSKCPAGTTCDRETSLCV